MLVGRTGGLNVMLYDFHSKVPTPTATGLFPLTGSDGKCCWRRTFFLFIVPFFSPLPVLFTSRFPTPSLLPFTGSERQMLPETNLYLLIFPPVSKPFWCPASLISVSHTQALCSRFSTYCPLPSPPFPHPPLLTLSV